MKLIALSGKRGAGKFALVDDADYEILATFKWYLNDDGYAWATLYTKMVKGKVYQKSIKIHRLILLLPRDLEVDHKDGNPLNNQRYNLRPATRSQNVRNVTKYKTNISGFKGVYWNKASNKWRAQIQFNGKNRYLGDFLSPVLAAQAYDTAALEFHKEFARTNF